MRYVSTRGRSPSVTASQALVAGIAPDGGLYVPESIPQFTPGELKKLAGLPYTQRAEAVLGRFFDDFTAEELRGCIQGAWGEGSRFDGEPAPLRAVGDTHVLELWHGPTAAFKDMALQWLPRAMVVARAHLGIAEKTLILVATSGDTGKAALEGFADVPGTGCAVFYPDGGVSQVQHLQMVTQRGSNVAVLAVRGNFDDAQNGVKRLFADEGLRAKLAGEGWALSSANSINWGRLAPQIVYYVSAWCDLAYNTSESQGEALKGDEIPFVVPTGNFGNILAAWYARAMGVPIGRLVCASNRNRVLTDFFRDGVYDAGRAFYKTISPSMDILISSNLERMLYEAGGRDAGKVSAAMAALQERGRYTVDADTKAALDAVFLADCTDDDQTRARIRQVYETTGYLLDPHTAVAWDVWARLGCPRNTVIVSTASPYKFTADVLEALTGRPNAGGPADCDALVARTGVPMPRPLAEVFALPQRHNAICDPADMGPALLKSLNLER